MKTNTLFVTALISALFVIAPVVSQATCSTHKSQQAGNETSVGGNKVAGGEGTGVGDKTFAGNETSVGGGKIAGGEGTGIEGKVLLANEPSSSGNTLVK